MGSQQKNMPLTEVSARYKAIEESIRQLAADSGLTPEQVAKGVTSRFRAPHGGSTGGRQSIAKPNLKEIPRGPKQAAQDEVLRDAGLRAAGLKL